MQTIERLQEFLKTPDFLVFNQNKISRERLFSMASVLAIQLKKNSDPCFYISKTNVAESLVKAFASILAGKIPVFGSQRSSEDINLNFADARDQDCREIFLKKGPVIAFSTSGSTGESKILFKSWDNLLSETEELISILNLSSEDTVFSLVPIHHIYGFLFSFLTPLFSGQKVRFFEATDMMDMISVGNRSGDAACIVMTPALWTLAKRCIQDSTRLIVSSGAALSEAIEQEFIEISKRHSKPIRMLEVIGSTETGGMGYRTVGQSKSFRAFRNIKFKNENDLWFIDSPFIEESLRPFLLSDELELEGEEFYFKGRSDRIFKYSGKRFSLELIEKNMREILPASINRLVCCFDLDPAEPKGGLLKCFVESAELNILDLRKAYVSKFDSPFPERIYFLDKFPLSDMGKISLDSLKQLI